jgi:hypothetical protein
MITRRGAGAGRTAPSGAWPTECAGLGSEVDIAVVEGASETAGDACKVGTEATGVSAFGLASATGAGACATAGLTTTGCAATGLVSTGDEALAAGLAAETGGLAMTGPTGGLAAIAGVEGGGAATIRGSCLG